MQETNSLFVMIQERNEEKYKVISINNDKLDMRLSPDLKSKITLFFGEGGKNCIIDLSACRFCDSSGLSAILLGHRLSRENNGCMVVVANSDHILKLIEISQLDNILNVVPTLDEAIDFIFMDEIERSLNDEEAGEDLP